MSGNSYRIFTSFDDADGLFEQLLCRLRIVGEGEGEETAHPAGEFGDVGALLGPGYVDDLLQGGDDDCSWVVSDVMEAAKEGSSYRLLGPRMPL